ncbi:MAG: carboxymuconolactone decarboxylase family protein [Deltaproteobacteria bacterium]|nr:carboxymuconolactone decarboxylase family protein [Deltaproteobacteria bacterium]
MNTKEKELIAIAVSVAAGCEPCTQHHVKAAKEAGGQPNELRQMVETALSVRERATQRMSAVAWEELGTPAEFPSCDASLPPSQLEALASAACALAANCGVGVPGFLSAAMTAGASERDGEVALGIARQIKKVAAEKADETARGDGKCTEARSCCSAVTREGSPACC